MEVNECPVLTLVTRLVEPTITDTAGGGVFTGIYFHEFHEFLLIVKMLDTIPSAHTYIRTCVSMQHQTRSC